MDTWEYICNQSPPEALKTVRFHIRTKVLEHNGGAEHGVRPLLGRLRSLKSLKGAVLGAREWWSGLTP